MWDQLADTREEFEILVPIRLVAHIFDLDREERKKIANIGSDEGLVFKQTEDFIAKYGRSLEKLSKTLIINGKESDVSIM